MRQPPAPVIVGNEFFGASISSVVSTLVSLAVNMADTRSLLVHKNMWVSCPSWMFLCVWVAPQVCDTVLTVKKKTCVSLGVNALSKMNAEFFAKRNNSATVQI